MTRKAWIAIAAGTLATLLLAAALTWRVSPALLPWTLDPANPGVTLADVEREVARRWQVTEIATDDLARRMQSQDVTLFDVRTVAEFELGHLQGAIRVDPDTSAEDFLAQHGDRLRGKPVVFYCAVGVRSSVMMQRLIEKVATRSKAEVYNLRGGAFRWVADGQPLVAQSRPGKLHPYDDNWGKLLARTLAR